jgi:ABC-type transport system substrate-binding protein
MGNAMSAEQRRSFASFVSRAALVLALASLAAPLACRRSLPPPAASDPNAPPRKGGVFRYASNSDFASIDPAVAFDTESAPFVEMMFDGLVATDADGRIVPSLAERWEVLDGGRTYRFSLRTGVRMHDGTLLEADDVKRSAERALAKETACPAAQFFSRIVGFDAWNSGRATELTGIVVEGPHTITFHLSTPDATFLSVLTLPTLRPVCRSAGRRYEDEFARHACGSGRFRLEAWEPGRFISVRRFDGHRDADRTWLDGLRLSFGVANATQRLLFEHGELDALDQVLRTDLIRFREDPRWAPFVHGKVQVATYGELLNTGVAPFDDARVRKAVAAAIDRAAFARYFESGSVVTGRLMPPGMPGVTADLVGQSSDLSRALSLMAEAGYPFDPSTGRGGYPKPITYYTSEGESALRYAQLIQYQLSRIGLRLELRVVSFSQYNTILGRPGAVPMGFTGWVMDYPDPSDFFEPIFTRAAIASEGSTNWAFYSNPKLDALVERAHVETDADRRRAMYAEAEQLVCDEAPWAFVYNPLQPEILQPWVHGSIKHPYLLHYFFNTWLDRRDAELARRDGRPWSPARTFPTMLAGLPTPHPMAGHAREDRDASWTTPSIGPSARRAFERSATWAR